MIENSLSNLNISANLHADKKIIDSLKKYDNNDEKNKTNTFDSLVKNSKLMQDKAKKPIDKKLMKTCIEFESIFVARMLKEMKKTVHKSNFLHGGHAEKIFEDMLYDEYALKLSKNSNLGLAKMLYDELSQKTKTSTLSMKG